MVVDSGHIIGQKGGRVKERVRGGLLTREAKQAEAFVLHESTIAIHVTMM